MIEKNIILFPWPLLGVFDPAGRLQFSLTFNTSRQHSVCPARWSSPQAFPAWKRFSAYPCRTHWTATVL